MQEKHCAECRKLRTEECRRPGHCVQHQFSDFAPNHPHVKCQFCGARLRVDRTDPVTKELVLIDKHCPDCKAKYQIRFETIVKRSPAA